MVGNGRGVQHNETEEALGKQHLYKNKKELPSAKKYPSMEKAALESSKIYITSIQLDYRPFYIETIQRIPIWRRKKRVDRRFLSSLLNSQI